MEDWNFDSIEHPTALYLIQTDDKFGEWGGDSYFLKMYRYKRSSQFQIDYIEYEGNNGPPYPPGPLMKGEINWFAGHPILFQKKHIQVDERYLKLISSSIQELLKAKIENKDFITHAGVKNTIMYGDSSMIIQDYPSIKWDKFHELKHLIKK